MLAITVWSLAHPVAVTRHIELDEAGMPVWVGAPTALPRTAVRRTHGEGPGFGRRWALPAIARRLEELPDTVEVTVVLETQFADEALPPLALRPGHRLLRVSRPAAGNAVALAAPLVGVAVWKCVFSVVKAHFPAVSAHFDGSLSAVVPAHFDGGESHAGLIPSCGRALRRAGSLPRPAATCSL